MIRGVAVFARGAPDCWQKRCDSQGPAPHNDGQYVIFGELVSGWHVAEAINAVSRGKPDDTAGTEEGVVIADCGQHRRGTLQPDLEQ